MTENLSIQQKISIYLMLRHLANGYGLCKWTLPTLLLYFEDYKLEKYKNENLDSYTYYKELKYLPLEIKRDIMHKLFLCWKKELNYHGMSLYEAFSTLVYLKICSAPEFFFMNIFISLMDYFGTNFMADSYAPYYYEIYYNGNREHSIQFDVDEGCDFFQIKISGYLINSKTPFFKTPSSDDVEPIMKEVISMPYRESCPWIYYNGSIKTQYEYFGPNGNGLFVIKLSNLEYEDNNGGY